jgi:oligoendopeptidase F
MLPKLRKGTALIAGALCLLLGAATVPSLAQDAVTEWDLTHLYPTKEAWNEAREDLKQKVEDLQAYKGKLGDDPQTLAKALDIYFDGMKEAMRAYSYANMLSDLDTRKSGPQGMLQEMQAQFAEMSAKTAWVDPEILSIPADELDAWVADSPELSDYARYIERLQKQREHTLDAKSEEILGAASLVQGDGATVGKLLLNAEIPWRTIEMADGEEMKIDVAGYTRGRASDNRIDRIRSYAAFYGTLADFQQTIASSVAATVKEHVFRARVRNYDDTLHAALEPDEIDPAVYQMLIDEVNAALPTLHRYLELRARMLGIEDLGYHDLYPSLVGPVDLDFGWNKSKALVLEAMAPLGEDYVSKLRRAYEGGWVDVYPREGKRSGAYVNGAAYDVHPYMLLNHQDDYASTSTLAHESGHLVHSMYSNEAQPFPTADYETFVAEVASITDEWLFFEHMLDTVDQDKHKLAILGNFLESLRTTVYRQTMFAEFEREIHEMAEQSKPLTADTMNEIYLDLLRRYHGHDEGVCTIDERYAVEWAFIPHFHYDYYVYSYATSFVAATAFAQKIQENPDAAQVYVDKVLKAGSSKPPVEILRSAGVDMTTPQPIRDTVAAMNDVMDRIEAILAKKND